jgi:hypothetical protein
MEAINMSNTELRHAASTCLDFDVAVEIILRGDFSDMLLKAAWREYDEQMLEEELLLAQHQEEA